MKITHPEPKTPLQARAYRMLRELEGRKSMTRAELVALNHNKVSDTRNGLCWLREKSLVHISDWSKKGGAVFSAGPGKDAPYDHTFVKTRAKLEIPAPDPLLAALFARPRLE